MWENTWDGFHKAGSEGGHLLTGATKPRIGTTGPNTPTTLLHKGLFSLGGFKKIYKYFYSKFQIPSVRSYRFRSVPNYGKESWDRFRVKELECSITIFTASMFTLISSR